VVVRRSGSSRIHFPAPLRSTVVTRFSATTDALTPAGRFFGPHGHERRLSPAGLPDYCAGTSNHSGSNHLRVVQDSPGCGGYCPPLQASSFTRRLAQPRRPNRVHLSLFVETLLRTGRSLPVALHPALLRRSYGSIPHGSSPHRNGLPPFYPLAFSGARAPACSRLCASIPAKRVERSNRMRRPEDLSRSQTGAPGTGRGYAQPDHTRIHRLNHPPNRTSIIWP